MVGLQWFLRPIGLSRSLGQQGDPFDAQKDMALAFLGASLCPWLFRSQYSLAEETLILSETL